MGICFWGEYLKQSYDLKKGGMNQICERPGKMCERMEKMI